MQERQSIGFVGLGAMGLAMAENLLRLGYGVRAYNRTPERAQPLVELGAERAASPAAAVAGPGTVVVSMVADDRALEEVTLGADGLVGRLGAGGVHLSMSTVSPDTARRLADRHREQGEELVSAPVFGRPEAAAAAKLWICVSGAPAARERVRPLLDQLGQGVFDFGDDPAAAAVVKLSGNFLIGAAIEALAEAFTLAEKSGVPREAVHRFFSQTIFASPIYQNYGRIIAEQVYEPARFRLPLGHKDMALVLDTARRHRVPMPLAGLVHDRLLASLARGREELDWTGMALEVSEAAGLLPADGAPAGDQP